MKKEAAEAQEDLGFRASLLSHELGHAQDFEARKFPRLRNIGDSAASLGGTLAGISGEISGRPGLAAIGTLLREAPTLVNELAASTNAMRALKEHGMSEEDLRKVRNSLLLAGGTYGTAAAASVGGAALSAHLTRRIGKSFPIAGLVLGHLALPLAHKAYVASSKKSPVFSVDEGKRLRSEMGTTADIYRAARDVGKVENAMYVSADPKPTSWDKALLRPMLHTDERKKETLARIFSEGGVIVPKHPLVKKSSTDWSTLANALVL
jgi:hypothetical protein